jgi:hypothetical protein
MRPSSGLGPSRARRADVASRIRGDRGGRCPAPRPGVSDGEDHGADQRDGPLAAPSPRSCWSPARSREGRSPVPQAGRGDRAALPAPLPARGPRQARRGGRRPPRPSVPSCSRPCSSAGPSTLRQYKGEGAGGAVCAPSRARAAPHRLPHAQQAASDGRSGANLLRARCGHRRRPGGGPISHRCRGSRSSSPPEVCGNLIGTVGQLGRGILPREVARDFEAGRGAAQTAVENRRRKISPTLSAMNLDARAP